MKAIKLSSLIFVALFSLVGCESTSPAKVSFDQNTSIETIHYKTFAWLSEQKIMSLTGGLNPINKVRIETAIEAAFKAKGYQLITDAEAADFAISYTVGSRDKIKVDSFPTTYRTGFGWGRGYYGGVAMGTETRVRQYEEGKLAIDIFDVKSHQPAWHGWAVKRISSSDKENPEAVINTIVNQVVAQFK